MNDRQLNKKFAVAKGPVNQRLVTPSTAPDREQAAPAALARVQLAQAKHRLGTSLQERLGSVQSRSESPARLSTREIGIVIGGAVSAVALTLGLIQGSPLVAGIGGVCLTGLGALGYVAAKARRKMTGTSASDIGQFIDAKDIAALDAEMVRVAAESPPETVARLSAIKDQISRCAELIAGANGEHRDSGILANEDQLFIRECVRRYLPDTLASYLKVPPKDRATVVIDEGKTAQTLLHEQIGMLKNQLAAKETRLTRDAGEPLMRQQRFLSVKTKT